MAIARDQLTAKAKQVAQDPASGNILLLAADDYNRAIDLALETFKVDRPNLRVVHYTAIASGFRFVLAGAGLVTPASGLDKWIGGGSFLQAVFAGFDVTTDQNLPLDTTRYIVRDEPGPLTVLTLLQGASVGAGSILRLEFTRPHEVAATVPADSSIREADVTALITLTAAEICDATARRYVQNTGSSVFQNESVDRRSQSDVMASRAKDLRKAYGSMVGKGAEGSGVQAAGVVRRLQVDASSRRGFMWPH